MDEQSDPLDLKTALIPKPKPKQKRNIFEKMFIICWLIPLEGGGGGHRGRVTYKILGLGRNEDNFPFFLLLNLMLQSATTTLLGSKLSECIIFLYNKVLTINPYR